MDKKTMVNDVLKNIKSEKYTKINYNIYYQKLKNTNDYWSRNFIEKFSKIINWGKNKIGVKVL